MFALRTACSGSRTGQPGGARGQRPLDELSVRQVQSALLRYRDESLQKLLFCSPDSLSDDLIKVREDTEWERCSRRPATANAVKLKNRGERQRLEVTQIYLERQLTRELRRIELQRCELVGWWHRRVGGPSTRHHRTPPNPKMDPIKIRPVCSVPEKLPSQPGRCIFV